MSTGTVPGRGDERRFDGGSWAALIYALAVGLGSLLLVIGAWRIPSDGWLYDGSLFSAAPAVTFQTNLSGRSSPLQAGDQLIAVEGIALEALADRAHAFYALRPPAWPDGQSMRYTVLRGDQLLTIDVPLYRIAPWTYQLALVRIEGLIYVLQLVSSPFFFGIGLAVFLLRPRARAAHALLIAGTGFLFQAVPELHPVTTAFFPYPPPSVGFDYWSAAILPSIVYLMLVFPVPLWPARHFPRLTPIMVYAAPTLGLNLAYLLNLNDRAGYDAASNVVYIAEGLATLVAVSLGLLYAALTLRGQVERTQLSWMGAGLLCFVLLGIGGWMLLFFGGQRVIGGVLSIVGWFVLPLCLAIAILRYRLFDIDVIIRRTLVYAVVTTTLGAIYLLTIVLIQALFVRLTGETSTLAVVASTLGIAALFAPLRARVQSFIDRRFFRRKYDAQQVLHQFAARAQREADLDALSADLVATVQETLEPDGVKLWLLQRP
jgi:hypothetical protein